MKDLFVIRPWIDPMAGVFVGVGVEVGVGVDPSAIVGVQVAGTGVSGWGVASVGAEIVLVELPAWPVRETKVAWTAVPIACSSPGTPQPAIKAAWARRIHASGPIMAGRLSLKHASMDVMAER